MSQMERHAEMGCCGYDEVEPTTRPQTTSPVYSLKAKNVTPVQKKTDGPLQTRRISFMGAAAYPVVNGGSQ
jgi:hypothetical protein